MAETAFLSSALLIRSKVIPFGSSSLRIALPTVVSTRRLTDDSLPSSSTEYSVTRNLILACNLQQ